MTLEELKLKSLALIEEYNENEEALTEDEDIALKLNSVINQIQNELARFKKIDAYTTLEVEADQEIALEDIDKNLYQLNLIRGVDYNVVGNRVIFNEAGTAKVYYYKYPTQINDDTDDSFTMELSTDALEIAPYGIAADLLKSDVSTNYGQVYANRYRELLQSLDPRNAMFSVYIEGSTEI